ncbi:MAG: hypothetical protein HYT94_03935 [Parcubacteria group bacterium]|nr:hypothetical protein [Parcubacteria group bacterium]
MTSFWFYIINTIGIASVMGGLVYIGTKLIYIGRKLESLDTLTSTTEKMKNNISALANHLIKKAEFNPSELQNYSPVRLTEIGNQFIKTLGFDNVFAKHKKEFFDFIDEENPKLKYDVEIAAIKSISVFYDKEYMSFLKVYLYNTPKRSMENTAPTLGVYIRDVYLAEHPEITQ